MGYYSDVSLCLSKTGANRLKESLENATLELKQEVERLLEYADTHTLDASTGAEFWLWSDIKWYSDFPDVGFMEAFMRELDERDYYFLRVGEADDDTERLGCYLDNPFNIYLVRSIHFSGQEEITNGKR